MTTCHATQKYPAIEAVAGLLGIYDVAGAIGSGAV